MSVECETRRLLIGEWLVEPALDQMSRAGEIIKLEPRTMRLLMRLADAQGQVVSSKQLLHEVWPGVIVGSASLYQAVSQLRKLLGDADETPTYVATVPRKGYRLIASVRTPPLPTSPGDAVPESPTVASESSLCDSGCGVGSQIPRKNAAACGAWRRSAHGAGRNLPVAQ